MKPDYEPYEGYYTLPFSREPFKGQVIVIDGPALNVLYQHYWTGDEHSFREWLTNADNWLADKSYKVYCNWLKHIVNWLEKRKQERA